MKRLVFIWVLVVWLGAFSCAAAANWRDDFALICGHTADAGKLSSGELRGLIAESDKLLEIVESSDDPEKKLYLMRLNKCRNFFVFMEGITKN